MKNEALALDVVGIIAGIGGDMDLEAGGDRAARAIGSRCDKKYQSSVTT